MGSRRRLLDCIDEELQIYQLTALKYNFAGYALRDIGVAFANELEPEKFMARKTIDIAITNYEDYDDGKIFVPELYNNPENTREIRAYCTYYEPCYVHMWNEGSGLSTPWPGIPLVNNKVSETTYYAIIDKSQYTHMIFNRQGRPQTGNLVIPSYQDLTYAYNGSDLWRRYIYSGSWHNYDDWTAKEYDTTNNRWVHIEYDKWNVGWADDETGVWHVGDNVKFSEAQLALGYK